MPEQIPSPIYIGFPPNQDFTVQVGQLPAAVKTAVLALDSELEDSDQIAVRRTLDTNYEFTVGAQKLMVTSYKYPPDVIFALRDLAPQS